MSGVRKRIRHCGRYGIQSDFRQVSYYTYTPTRAPTGRRRKSQTSTPKQRALNNKRSARYLEALTHANFGRGDLLLGLSYAEEHAPKGETEAKKEFGNFIRRLNYRRKKKNLPPARWIAVTEIGKKGRIHHHVIMDAELDRDEVEEVWGRGYANTKRLKPDPREGLLPVIGYIAKTFKEDDRPKGRRKWDCSKNLIRPWDSVNDNPRMMSRKKIRQMKDLPEDSESMRQIIEADNPNYELISVEKEYREDTGQWYFFCRMKLSNKQVDDVDNARRARTSEQENGKCKIIRHGNTRAKPPPENTERR